jgi:hypothetical protein
MFIARASQVEVGDDAIRDCRRSPHDRCRVHRCRHCSRRSALVVAVVAVVVAAERGADVGGIANDGPGALEWLSTAPDAVMMPTAAAMS